MRFDYSPAQPDDWPDVIDVTVSGVGDEHGSEEGETRRYEPNWKHRMAGNTIREQREQLREAVQRASAACDALEKAVHCCNSLTWNNGICAGAECKYFACEGDNARCLMEEAVATLGVQAPLPTAHRTTSDRIGQLMIFVKSLWLPLNPKQREWLEARFEEMFGCSLADCMCELGIEVSYEVDQ